MRSPMLLAVAAILSGLLGLACEPRMDPSETPPQSNLGPQPGSGPCQPAECGPLAEIARVCDDGSTGNTQCNRMPDAICRWEHVCPAKPPAGAATGAGTGAATPSQPPQPAAPDGFVEANNGFAQRFYAKIAPAPGNVFVSPASVSTALAMTYAGARGETAAQMAKTLGFTLPPDALHRAFSGLAAQLQQQGGKNAPELKIANRLWGQAGLPIEADFRKVTEEQYRAGIELVDFKKAPEPARGQINKWVEDQTAGKIKDLLPQGSVNALTRLVLTNAIYFKGKWATPFDKAQTKNEPFTIKPGTAPAVPMMRKTMRAAMGETADAAVLELAYEAPSPDRTLAMVVILPKAADGLPKVEEAIAAGRLRGYIDTLQPGQVDVALPRFKASTQLELSKTLLELGMPLAFDDKKADFTGITKAEPLYITQVRHKAFVDVNEEGTEAAAATGVVMGTRSMPAPPRVFRADHPFVFLIRDVTTGTVLFLGRLSDPR